MNGQAHDLYAAIAQQIIDAIERGAGDFQMPWHRGRGATSRPWNAASGRRYQGINIISLWLSAEAQGFTHPIWATYKQWHAHGAQVRRGEKSSIIVFYKTLERPEEGAEGEATVKRVPMARASHVFNAAQVDGYEPPELDRPWPTPEINYVDVAEALVRDAGVAVRHGGDRAYFNPNGDFVAMPDKALFTGTSSMSPTESYYATLLHETVHWTGAKSRLDRDLTGRFGTNAYAMEELVAELGASYLCADLAITTALRPDHAAYIQSWLQVMRGDTRAIFTAAARAQQAMSFLAAYLPPDLRDDALVPTRPSKEAGSNPQGPEWDGGGLR